MIKEALEYLVSLNKPNIIVQNDFVYSDKKLQIFQNPMIAKREIHTLSGLLQYCNTIADENNKIIIHIRDEKKIDCYSLELDKWNRRKYYVDANPIQVSGFSYGYWLDIEDFIVGLRANFVMNDAIVKIIQILGNVTENDIKDHLDDGITQTVTAKLGINLKTEIELPPIVKLAPYRTFAEIEQPESEFIFRMKKGEGSPKCALFQCFDARWKLDAMDKIFLWLSERVVGIGKEKSYTIIA